MKQIVENIRKNSYKDLKVTVRQMEKSGNLSKSFNRFKDCKIKLSYDSVQHGDTVTSPCLS